MSVLDTFFILFQPQGVEAVEAGAARATGAGKKLESELDAVGEKGVASAKEIAEENSKLAESFDKIKEHAGEMASRLIEHALEVAAAFEALFAVEKLVDSVFETAEQSDQLGERAKSLGVDVSELDAWGNAAKRVGGSADAFGESLININRQMSRMEATGKSRILPFFKQLGVAMQENGKNIPIMELLPRLAKSTEGKSKQETAGALRGIGFDEGTIRLLQRGDEGVKALIARQRELGNVTEEDAETAEKFNIEWMDIKQLFHELMVEFDTYFLPTLERLLDTVEDITKWLEAHEYAVVGFFGALAAGILYAARAMGVFDLTFLLNPVVLITTAIIALAAAFGLVYEDLMVFSKGGKSLIGDLAKLHPWIGTLAHGILDFFKDVGTGVEDFVTDVIDWIKRLPEGFAQWQDILDTIFPGLNKSLSDTDKHFSETDLGKHLKRWGKDARDLWYIFLYFWNTLVSFAKFLANIFVDPKHAFDIFADDMKTNIKLLEDRFPGLAKAFAAVGKEFKVIADGIAQSFDIVYRSMDRIAHPLGGSWKHDEDKEIHDENKLRELAWRRAEHAQMHPDDKSIPGLASAQAMLSTASTVPMAALTPGSAWSLQRPQTVQQTNNQNVTINAPNSDPQAIADAAKRALQSHATDALQHYADGVSH